MDAQLKKGFLDAVVLASLVDAPSYGYKIIQELAAVAELSESTLYPILRRLELQNNVSTFSTPHNGRLRRYYQLTPSGVARIREFLHELREVARLTDYLNHKCGGKV